MENMRFFIATNKIPPQWFLYSDDNDYNTSEQVREKQKELDEMNAVIFVWVESKKEFIPLNNKYAHLGIQDFKFIIRTSPNHT
jgi:hypothetical protein